MNRGSSRWCCPLGCRNLLVNGAGGIAVGYATNIPTHNLSEVIEGLLLLLETQVTIAQLMKKFPAGLPHRRFIYGVRHQDAL